MCRQCRQRQSFQIAKNYKLQKLLTLSLHTIKSFSLLCTEFRRTAAHFFLHQFNVILFYISLFKNKNRNRLSKLTSNFSLLFYFLIFNLTQKKLRKKAPN